MKATEILETLKAEDVATSLDEWVQLERRATVVVIGLLVEIERDKAYRDMGFATLYAFCTKRLGYSPSAARARIRAACAALLYQAILDELESRALSLTAAGLLSPYLTGDLGDAELVSLARHKSCRYIKELIARRFPQPESPGDSVRCHSVGDGRLKIEVIVASEVADKLQLAQKLARESGLSDNAATILSQALDRYLAYVNGTLLFGPKRTVRATPTRATSGRPPSTRPGHEPQPMDPSARPPSHPSETVANGALLERDELFAALIELGHPPSEAERRTRQARSRSA
jgi:hypothetical protein